MPELEQIDKLLDEAFEKMLEVATLVKENQHLNTSDNLMYIAMASNNLWGLRDQIYIINPDLKQGCPCPNVRDDAQESK